MTVQQAGAILHLRRISLRQKSSYGFGRPPGGHFVESRENLMRYRCRILDVQGRWTLV